MPHSVQVSGSGTAIGSAFDVTVGGVGRDLTLRYEYLSDLEHFAEWDPGVRGPGIERPRAAGAPLA